MSVVVVTPPAPAIDRDLVDAHLRLEVGVVHEDDALIDAFVSAAVAHIDGPGGWLDRCIWPQTLELRQDTLSNAVRLPYGPVSGVTSVKTVDSDGVEQTMSGADYVLTNSGDLVLAHDAVWPTVRGDAEGVRIRYVAGYAALPPAILTAVLLMVGDLYANRETVVTGTIAAAVPMSMTVQNLLAPFKAWSV